MLILGLHCANEHCDVALTKNNNVLAAKSIPMKRGHDQQLPVLTQDVLQEAGARVADIESFAVCVGPGSFTGIRVGVAFARGLALSADKMAYGVTSLEAMLTESTDNSRILCLSPAKRRFPDVSFWAQSFGADTSSEPEEISVDRLKNEIAHFDQIIISEKPDDMLKSFFSEQSVKWEINRSSAIGVNKFVQNTPASALRSPTPVYVRAPDATPAKPKVS